MAFVLSDRIKETTTTTGTGTYTLGGAVSGFETFTANLSNGDTTYYCCTDGTDFEVGLGTFASSGTTLARTTIISSSNSNNAVSWSSGSRDIFCTLPGSKAIAKNGDGDASFADSEKIRFGSDNDGFIEHTGSIMRVFSSTGGLSLKTTADDQDVTIQTDDGSGGTTDYLRADGSTGAVKLSHYGSTKLETTSGGVTITGALTGNVTGDVTGDVTGNADTATTATNATNVTVSVNTSTDEDNRIPFVANASTSAGNHGLEMDTDSNNGLKYNPSTNTLTTNNMNFITSGGQANIIGTNTAGQLLFGMDGSFNNTVFFLDDEDGQPIFTFQEENGTAILDGGDTDVTSHKPFIADSTTTLNEDVTFTGASANIVFDKSENALEFADDAIAFFGNGSDLKIFHNGSNSFIREQGTGNLKLQATNLSLELGDGTLLLDTNDSTNAVQLYDNGELRLRTTDTGIDVLADDSDGSSDNTANVRIIAEGTNEIFTLRSNDGVGSYIIRNGSSHGDHLFQSFNGTDTTNLLRLTTTGHTFEQGVTVTGDATITSTDAGSSEGPSINLNRNSASPATNDLLGTISFKGEDSASNQTTYAKIQSVITDTTDGSEDGLLRLQATINGTATTYYDAGYGANFFFKNVALHTGVNLSFEGSTNDGNETTLTVTDPTADRTITLPDATGTVLTTGNSDTPTTTTSSSDADFVLVDDGGTMKKITPSNLGITGGGASKGFAVAMAIAL